MGGIDVEDGACGPKGGDSRGGDGGSGGGGGGSVTEGEEENGEGVGGTQPLPKNADGDGANSDGEHATAHEDDEEEEDGEGDDGADDEEDSDGGGGGGGGGGGDDGNGDQERPADAMQASGTRVGAEANDDEDDFMETSAERAADIAADRALTAQRLKVLSLLKLADLKELCKEFHLPVSGTKDVLKWRIAASRSTKSSDYFAKELAMRRSLTSFFAGFGRKPAASPQRSDGASEQSEQPKQGRSQPRGKRGGAAGGRGQAKGPRGRIRNPTQKQRRRKLRRVRQRKREAAAAAGTGPSGGSDSGSGSFRTTSDDDDSDDSDEGRGGGNVGSRDDGDVDEPGSEQEAEEGAQDGGSDDEEPADQERPADARARAAQVAANRATLPPEVEARLRDGLRFGNIALAPGVARDFEANLRGDVRRLEADGRLRQRPYRPDGFAATNGGGKGPVTALLYRADVGSLTAIKAVVDAVVAAVGEELADLQIIVNEGGASQTLHADSPPINGASSATSPSPTRTASPRPAGCR